MVDPRNSPNIVHVPLRVAPVPSSPLENEVVKPIFSRWDFLGVHRAKIPRFRRERLLGFCQWANIVGTFRDFVAVVTGCIVYLHLDFGLTSAFFLAAVAGHPHTCPTLNFPSLATDCYALAHSA